MVWTHFDDGYPADHEYIYAMFEAVELFNNPYSTGWFVPA